MINKQFSNTKSIKIAHKKVARMIFAFLIVAGCIAGYQHHLFADEKCSTTEDEWYPPSAGPLITWTAPVCRSGELDVQPYFFYNRTRGTFDDKDHYKSFKDKEKRSQF